MAVLYRKYRPQVFEQVVGQKPITLTLKNQVLSGSLAHAYLFTGSRGVGKTSVARILAKAVNCLERKGDGDACGQCSVCKQIEAGNFMDLVEIDAASNTGVDNIRELIEHVKFSPSQGKYKVFIIDEVHMLSKGAFNALLKTLEEPPKHAIFILATTEINKVPATIVSRTQRFDFRALNDVDLVTHLQNICAQENISLDPEVLQLVVQNAEGSVRDSLSLLEKLLSLGQKPSPEDARVLLGITDLKLSENLLSLITEGGVQNLPDFFTEISQKGTDFVIFNRDFLEYLRKALVFKVSDGKIFSGLSEKSLEAVSKLTGQLSSNDLIFIIRLFLKSYKDLSTSPLPEIPMLLASIEGAMRKQPAGSVKHEVIIEKESSINKINSEFSKSETIVKSEMVESKEAVSISLDNITFEEAQSVWPKAIAKIKQVNGPLASMLKGARLDSVQDGKIVIAVKFDFDKQSLQTAKNSSLIASTISEVSGKKVGLKAEVQKAENKEEGTAAETISEALKVFGGEVVE